MGEKCFEVIVWNGAGQTGQRRRLFTVAAVDRDDLNAGDRVGGAEVRVADAAGAEDADPHGRRRADDRLLRGPDLDLAVPDLVAVVLQEDVPLLRRAEAGDVLELALRD